MIALEHLNAGGHGLEPRFRLGDGLLGPPQAAHLFGGDHRQVGQGLLEPRGFRLQAVHLLLMGLELLAFTPHLLKIQPLANPLLLSPQVLQVLLCCFALLGLPLLLRAPLGLVREGLLELLLQLALFLLLLLLGSLELLPLFVLPLEGLVLEQHRLEFGLEQVLALLEFPLSQ